MRFQFLASAFGLVLLAAPHARAHVRLVFPTPRYETPPTENGNDQNIKFAPCGVAGDSRTTDPTRITTFQPGETITVQFNETVEHPGHYRIAFDDDGQDDFVTPLAQTDVQQTPVLPVLADGIADVPDKHEYEVQVTLPTTPCENCTLQVIQVMTTAQTWTEDEIYFTCADIRIEAGAGTGGMGGMPGGGTGGAGGSAGSASGAGGTGVGGAGGSPSGGGMSSGGSAGGGGTGNTPLVMPPPPDDGGCSVGQRSSSGAAALLLLLGLFGAFGRRRRCS